MVNFSLTLPGGYTNSLGGPADEYYLNRTGPSTYAPYTTAAAAAGAVPVAARNYRLVNIGGVNYWWTPDNVTDAGLKIAANSNFLKGGLHNAATVAAMRAISPDYRDFGMQVWVYNDPSVSNNGLYALAGDLQTFVLQNGSSAFAQFPAYSPTGTYNNQSAYQTYPDQGTPSAGLRLFLSTNTGPVATQPAPLSATNVLNPAWTEIAPGAAAGGSAAAAAFQNDLAVSLSGGKTWGTIKNGDVITKGTPFETAFRRALIETLYPTYTPATLTLTESQPVSGEVGQSVSNALVGTFTQNDAGALSNLQINRNGVLVGVAGTVNPDNVTETVVRSLAGVSYQAVANYAAGPVKNVTPGNTPDTRAAAIRTVNAPQAAETGFTSNTVQILGFYRLWFGAVASGPLTSADARAISGSQTTDQGLTNILNTGTTASRFAIVLPPGRTLSNVTDLDNANTNITTAYVAQATITVNDAGGSPVAGYTPYVYQAATPYATSARHQFTYA